MIAKFALYRKADGEVFVVLPGLPDNDDYLTSGTVIFNGRPRAVGVKWDAVDVWQNTTGASLDEAHLWRYDATTSEFVDMGPKEVV